MFPVGKKVQAVDPASGCWLHGTVRDVSEFHYSIKWTGYQAKNWVEKQMCREQLLKRSGFTVDKSNFPIFKCPQNLQAGDKVCCIKADSSKGQTLTISINDKFKCKVTTIEQELSVSIHSNEDEVERLHAEVSLPSHNNEEEVGHVHSEVSVPSHYNEDEVEHVHAGRKCCNCSWQESYKKLLLEVEITRNEQRRTNVILTELLTVIRANKKNQNADHPDTDHSNMENVPISNGPIQPKMELDSSGFVIVGGRDCTVVPVTMPREKYIEVLKVNQRPMTVIKSLLDCLFERHELSRSNIGGRQGKDPLDERKVKAIMSQVFLQFRNTGIPISKKQLVNDVNEKCRYSRLLEKHCLNEDLPTLEVV
ncbi:uncharacterized protein LOC117113424 [Anneissia japonica]|uniref:uncharacterized protein LOC117113424 n=1 Tax=Anneissia japonica TaxID=1529436 RepID=UPI0014256646|nr:uncharacterized protein LOC117113424 [Anneissia japonica]